MSAGYGRSGLALTATRRFIMVRIISWFCFSFILVHGLEAQFLGLHAGADFNKIQTIPNDRTLADQSRKAGPGFGLSYIQHFGYISYFSTGLQYTNSRNTLMEADAADPFHIDLHHQGLRLPLQYGIRVTRKPVEFSLFTGLNLGYNLKFDIKEYNDDGTTEVYDMLSDGNGSFAKISGGAVFGVMGLYRGLSLSFRYSIDFLIPQDQQDFPLPMGVSLLSVHLGYSLNLRREDN